MPKIAYIFPGQGSQFVGMLSDFASNPIVKSTFASVSDHLSYDVWKLAAEGPEDLLNTTAYTQVVMLTADVALFKLLQNQGLKLPDFMAGHSLGEYAALVCAEAINLSDAALLVQKRGQVMQETVPLGKGSMAAIVGLSDEEVQSICKEASTNEQQVTPANYNAIGQVVIAGNMDCVEKAIHLAETRGARLAKKIPVSVPCHCPLLQEASFHFGEILEKAHFTAPKTRVISNVDLSIYENPTQIKSLLQKQLYSPVRWVETIQFLRTQDVLPIVECGPGKVLTGLVKRIDKTLNPMTVGEQMNLDITVKQLNQH